MLENIFPLILLMLSAGLIGGILAGLLGVGGGIVIVPVLEFALELLGVDPAIRMHIAIATSLATIIPTSISSARAHHSNGAVDLNLIKSWGLFILIGAVFGTWIASQVESSLLAAVFATIALLVALKMMLPIEDKIISDKVPIGITGAPIPFSIGTISTMMGIGGGSMTVPILTLLSRPIHQAVGTSALFGLIISLPGTIGFIYAGWEHASLPFGSLGYVNIVGLLIISPATALSAPLGAKLAHILSRKHLSLAFGVFLFIAGIRMLHTAFVS